MAITATLFTPAAHAINPTILQPVSVLSNVDSFSPNFTPINLINQSWLLLNHESVVTNFNVIGFFT